MKQATEQTRIRMHGSGKGGKQKKKEIQDKILVYLVISFCKPYIYQTKTAEALVFSQLLTACTCIL
jgi:hypothetical protein